MYIRRDQSNLHFGRQGRRRGGKTLFIVWLITMGIAIAIIWRFNSVQSWVLASVNGSSTATPDAVTLAQLGERAYWQGDLETAIDYYGQAARLEPNNIDIQFEYGRVLIYRSYGGRSYEYLAEEALQVAQQAVEIAPDNTRAQAILAFALLENGRYEEAIQAGLRATQLDVNYAEAHAYLSMAYFQAGRPRQAFDEGDLAVQKNPNSVDARRALALSLSFVGEWNAAIQQYEMAIQIHPRLYALYFELAPYYIIQDNYDAAIAAFDRVLAMEPNNVKAYTRKCETYFRQRDDSRAQEACEQATELDKTYPEAWRQLGMVQYAKRNYEGAIESFQTCINLQTEQGIPLEKQEIECYYIQGLSWALLAHCEKAWPNLQTALTMNPSETVKGFINTGLQSCVGTEEDEFSADQIPTPIPPTPVPPEPIGIY